jgi:hypothetical protein
MAGLNSFTTFWTPGFFELLLVVGLLILVIGIITSQVKRRSEAPGLYGGDLLISYDSPEAKAIGFTQNSVFCIGSSPFSFL